MKRLKLHIAILLASVIFFSCVDEFLDEEPKGVVELEELANEEGLDLLLIGAYAVLDGFLEHPDNSNNNLMPWHAAASNWMYGNVVADDAYKGSDPGDQPQANALENFTASSSNDFVRGKWITVYEGIARCNTVLHVLNVALAKGAIDLEKAPQIRAEARFLRAHYHFEAKKMWNMVPYIDETAEDPRVPNDREIWPDIEADFEYASNTLPDFQTDQGRATRWSAQAYLAKVLMFQNKYSEALPILNEIIASGEFELEPNFHDNFNALTNNNDESIFEVQFAVNDGTAEGQNGGLGEALSFPFNGGPSGCCGFNQPSQNLVNAFKTDPSTGLPLFDTFNDEDLKNDEGLSSDETFEPDNEITLDPRLDWTVGRRGIPYLDWGNFPGKDWIRNQGYAGPYAPKKNVFPKSQEGGLTHPFNIALQGVANNYRMIRYADILLWTAECEVEIGDLNRARDLVDLIRSRARDGGMVQTEEGTPAANYLISTYAENNIDWNSMGRAYARSAVRFERRLELAMEGHRFFDLVRWGIAEQVINQYLETERLKRSYLGMAQFDPGVHEYFPIPQDQIDNSLVNGNPTLTQNPGY